MKLIHFLIIVILLFNSCEKNTKSDVPQLSLKRFNGDSTNLQDLAQNKITILVFWTNFCESCLSELSNIHFLYKKYKNDKKISFQTIAFNTNEEMKQFLSLRDTPNPYKLYSDRLKLTKFDMPILLTGKEPYDIYYTDDDSAYYSIADTTHIREIYKIFNLKGIPTAIIYDSKGKIIYQNTVTKDMHILEKKIDSLLAN